jgi:hypothetical protein
VTAIAASSTTRTVGTGCDPGRSALERLVEPFARERVDACLEVGGDGVVPVLAELVHELRPDEPADGDPPIRSPTSAATSHAA